jgi:inhibitor of KinA sporulation pathway (predicted exonuclease)
VFNVNNESVYNVKKIKTHVHGMEDMLKKLDMELEGRHHSGIDDTKNLARIVMKLL